MTYIYLVEDYNRVYIGKTISPKIRERHHKNKFGSHILFTIIDQVSSLDKKDWKPLECYWIEQFRCWGFELLNKNEGGNGVDFHTLETRRKLSIPRPWIKEQRTGNKLPEGTGEKISKAKLGIVYSKERNDKIRQTTKGISRPWVKLNKGIKRGPNINISKSKMGVKFSKEHKENIRKSKLGTKYKTKKV